MNRVYLVPAARGPIRSREPFNVAVRMRMHEEMIEADRRTQPVDGRTVVPKWRGGNQAHGAAEIRGHLLDLIAYRQIQRMKETDIPVPRPALDALSKFRRHSGTLFGSGASDALGHSH